MQKKSMRSIVERLVSRTLEVGLCTALERHHPRTEHTLFYEHHKVLQGKQCHIEVLLSKKFSDPEVIRSNCLLFNGGP